MVFNDLSQKRMRLKYAADVVLFDHNYDDASNGYIHHQFQRKNLSFQVIVTKKCDHHLCIYAESHQNQVQVNVDRIYKWCIDTVNSETLLRHISVTPGINMSGVYIRGAFTYFPFHIEDENLSSTTCLCEGGAKTWNVLKSVSQHFFEAFVASQVLAVEYLKDHIGEARQILAT